MSLSLIIFSSYIKLTVFIQADLYHTLFHCFSIHVGVVVPQLSLAVSSRFCFSFFLSFSVLVSLYLFVCVCVWGRDSSPNPASDRTHLCFLMILPTSHYLRYWLRISLRWATQLVKTPAPASLCVFSLLLPLWIFTVCFPSTEFWIPFPFVDILTLTRERVWNVNIACVDFLPPWSTVSLVTLWLLYICITLLYNTCSELWSLESCAWVHLPSSLDSGGISPGFVCCQKVLNIVKSKINPRLWPDTSWPKVFRYLGICNIIHTYIIHHTCSGNLWLIRPWLVNL